MYFESNHNMQALDKKTLIHAGVEAFVIAGVVYWSHRKTKNLQQQVDDLSKKVAEQHEMIARQNAFIQQHEDAIARIYGGMQSRPVRHQPRQPRPPSPEPEEDIDDLLAEELAELNNSNSNSKIQNLDSPEVIYVEECAGDECELKERPKKTKRRSKKSLKNA